VRARIKASDPKIYLSVTVSLSCLEHCFACESCR